VSTCSWLGWGSSAEEVAAKGKEVSNKDHLIAAKEKTTWNSRELSEERRGDKDNGAIPQHILAKKNGDKEKLKK
jgi:hypothetical protein